jgi:co-chaperonin GroES (HSP10)
MIKVNQTKLLVQDILETEAKTQAGIILPNNVIKAKTMKGTVLVVGDGTPDIKIVHQPGDIVLFHPASGQKLTMDDKEYRLIEVNEVFLSGSF